LQRHRVARPSIGAALVCTVLALGSLVRENSALPVAGVLWSAPVASSLQAEVSPPSISWPWPQGEQAAVGVLGIDGLVASNGAQVPVPIASLAKLMTAYIVLHDHPLGPGASGPDIEITAADQADWDEDLATDQSSVPLQEGEMLNERQLLEALLIRSANDVAKALARWDAGSVAGFVHKMNATALDLAMTHTRYTSPSGFDPTTVSTAVDVLKIAMADMAYPAFASTVDQSSLSFPLIAGSVPNYVSGVGQDGIVGVKSGFTSQAGGCIVLAARRESAAGPVTVLAAVLGQQGANALTRVQASASRLDDVAPAGVVEHTFVTRHQAFGVLRAPWSRHPVPVVAAHAVTLAVWWSSPIIVHRYIARLSRGLIPAHYEIAHLELVAGAGRRAGVRLITSSPLSQASWWWRIWR